MAVRKPTGFILVRADDGTEHVINEYSTVLNTNTIGNPGARAVGLCLYRLGDGSTVDRISDKKFQVTGSGIVLHFVARQPVVM